jgi:superoxide reductase
MTELSEKTEDQGQEKHVPIIEINGNKAKVKVGSIPHPMEETHYIQFIQLLIDENIYTKYLKPGQLPEAEFEIPTNYKEISAREYCNIHGLWKSK